MRQGVSVSALLFNLTLHEITEELVLGGTIINKIMRAHAYPDDIALVAWNLRDSQRNI